MSDLPILIGSGGRQVRAYRQLFSRASQVVKKQTEFYLEESYVGKREATTKGTGKFDKADFIRLLDGMLAVLFEANPPYLSRQREVFGDKVFDVTIDIGVNPPEEKFNAVTALNDICYPYGKRRGVKIEISRRRYNAGT